MNERGELFTLDEQLNAANKECDELIEENTKLQAQVSSLTKERDELKNDIEKRMQVADKIFKENRDLNSQLSNRDKEIEELKQNIRNFINEGEGFCPDCLDRALKDPEVDNDILRAQKSALQIHRNIKKRQDKKIESYENFKDSVLRSIKDCREVEPSLADCFENTCGIHVLLASLNKEGEEE